MMVLLLKFLHTIVFHLNPHTFPGVGDGDGVSVDVVLPLDDVLRPLDDLIGVTEELPLVPLVPLVELLGEVVLDMFRNADGTVERLELKNIHITTVQWSHKNDLLITILEIPGIFLCTGVDFPCYWIIYQVLYFWKYTLHD